MEKYTIKSAFTVANQLTRVNLIDKAGAETIIELPAKWSQYLTPGTKFNVLKSRRDGAHIAYVFKNQLYFTDCMNPLHMEQSARRILTRLPNIRNHSMDKLRFKYALLMAMQSRGVKLRKTWVENIVCLAKSNQK